MLQKIITECTWGEGPDVLVSINRETFTDYLSLTIEEARELAARLTSCAEEVEKMEHAAEQYFDCAAKGETAQHPDHGFNDIAPGETD